MYTSIENVCLMVNDKSKWWNWLPVEIEELSSEAILEVINNEDELVNLFEYMKLFLLEKEEVLE